MAGSLADRLHGHLYTVGPRLMGRISPQPEPPHRVWKRRVVEAGRDVTLSGLLSEPEARSARSNTLAIVLHGCGGKPSSHYTTQLAYHLYQAGHTVLRLAWRGSDLEGEDFYHAGQTADLHAVLEDPALAHHQQVWAIGFSLGGHACLHFAHESTDARLVKVAAICPVLNLIQTNHFIDSSQAALYRIYTLRGLREGYAKAAARGRTPTDLAAVSRANTFRAYDALTVVPRYGFTSVDDYYTRSCVSRIVDRITRPTLILSARHDPMLPWQIADGMRARFSSAITFRWAERGGHCAFPSDVDLGLDQGGSGFEDQLHRWLLGE
ncbi:MAG: alpha/beta fold hydrolase [Myxococcales bacterium]